MKRLVLALMMLSSPAWSAGIVVYVSPTGAGAQDGSSPANARSWASVSNNWTFNDRMQLGAGTYSTSMSITLGGSPGNRVMIVGDLANPANVVFTGSLSVNNRHYISVRGVKFNGDVSWVVSNQDSFTDWIALGSVTLKGFQNGVVKRFWSGTPNAQTRLTIEHDGTEDACSRISGTITQNVSIEDGNLSVGVTGGGGQANAWVMKNAHNIQLRRCIFTGYMGPGVNIADVHPFLWFRVKDSGMEDCSFRLRNDTTVNTSGNYIFAIRDSSRFNVFHRDTFSVDTSGAGMGKVEFTLSGTDFGSGSSCPAPDRWSGSGSCRYNTYRYCVFDADGGFGIQNAARGDSIAFCSFYSDGGFNYLVGDSLTFVYNTIFSKAGVALDTDGSQPTSAINYHHNILYSDGGSINHNGAVSGRIVSPITFNYNLQYARIPADSAIATWEGQIGAGTSRCLGPGLDCNSRWFPPMFTRPSRPNPDLRPVAGAFALQTGFWNGTACGAYGTAFAGDATAPAAITNATISNITTTSYDVQFTSPGDDGNTGTPASYLIRWQVGSAIDTQGEWDAAAVMASPPSAVAAGTPVSFTLGGLSASTLVYVCIRAIDEENNLGGFSNAAGATTAGLPDASPPATISTLTIIGSLTSTSGLIQWQAPGDDGTSGFATSYQGRYSTAPIVTVADWNAATSISGMPVPQAPGTLQSKLVSGLLPSTRYYFNVRALDEVSNIGGVSNTPTGVTAAPPDATAPATIPDLSAAALSATRINLGWTQAGDDDYSGVASSCEVRRAATAITTEGEWASATSIAVIGSATISTGGEQQTYADDTVSPSTTYFYAVRAVDEIGNVGGISNSPSATTPASDLTAPDPISTLAATATGAGTIRLDWVATGNDGGVGTASNYRIKRRVGATFVLGDSAAATVVPNPPQPAVAGTPQSLTVGGLTPGTQYAFAMWVQDATINTSGISNAATATTQSAPSVALATKAVTRKMSMVIR